MTTQPPTPDSTLNPAFRLYENPGGHEDTSRIPHLKYSDIRQWLKFFKAEARKAQMRHDSLEWEEWSSKAERAEGLLQRTPQQWAEDIITGASDYLEWAPMLHGFAADGDRLAQNKFDMLVKDSSIRLVQIAKGGSRHAVDLLAELAHSFTKVLNEIGRERPDLVATTARFMTSWPVLDSPHPMMSGTAPDYKSIKLGTALPIRLERGAKFPFHDKVGQVAWPLLLHVNRFRYLRVSQAIRSGEFCDRCERCLEPQGNDRGSTVQPVCSGCGFKLLPDEGNSGSSGPGRDQCELCARRRSPGQPKSCPPFVPSDFIDLPGLESKLRNPTDAASIHIKGLLSKWKREEIAKHRLRMSRSQLPLPPPLISTVEQCNRILRSSSLFALECFKEVALRPETKALLSQNPQGVALLRVNRLLLEDAYPQHLSKEQSSKHCPLCELRVMDADALEQKRAGFTLLERATYLPEFSPTKLVTHRPGSIPVTRPASAAEWWSVAKGCLIAGYPDKVVTSELDETASVFDGIITAPSHCKTPGDKRYRTLERLKERFEKYANSSHYAVKAARKKSEVVPKT